MKPTRRHLNLLLEIIVYGNGRATKQPGRRRVYVGTRTHRYATIAELVEAGWIEEPEVMGIYELTMVGVRAVDAREIEAFRAKSRERAEGT